MATKPSSPALRLFLLGQPRILINDQPIPKLLVKAQALLFYLALTPDGQSRETLAGLFWGDLPEENARTNLRTALSRLRRHLGNRLVATRQHVQLAWEDGLWVDVVQFEKGLAGKETAVQRAAVALYRGEFLAGFYLRDAPAFEEWMLVTRVRLHQLALHGLDNLAAQAEQAGDWAQAVADLRQALALEPYREAVHRGLMRLLAESGDRAAALAQFDSCRRLLAEELDLEPAPATLTLYEAIRQGEVTAVSTPLARAHQPPPEALPHNLPANLTSFHGRAGELVRLQEALHDPGCRLLTLAGMGGMGKTRLAQAVARQIVASAPTLFADGVYWVSLTAVASQDELLTALATTLSFRFNGPDTPLNQLRNFLRHKSLLLLLDNLEQLVDEAPLLSELLQAAPGLKLLVTSRERLNLYEEWVLSLAGLPFPADEGDELADFPAVQLFAQRARQHGMQFDLAREAAGVRQICRLVEGMPLGLELAAAWTQAFSCAEIADIIAQKQEALVLQQRNVPARHHSLQAAFDFSWQLLTPEEQGVLSGLAVFRGGFTRAAAEEVVQATPRLLANLVAKSLVRREGNGRYGLHEQLRQFAWNKAAMVNQQQWADRHLASFATFLQVRGMALKTALQQQALAEVAADLDNVRGAWETAVAHREIIYLHQMVDPLFHFFSKQGLHQEGFRTFSQAIAALPTSDAAPEPARLRAALLVRQGRCGELISREYSTPRQLLSQGLDLARQHNMAEEMAQALFGLALLAVVAGDPAAAEQHLEASLALCTAHQLPWVQAHVLNMLAWIHSRRKESHQAITLGQQGLALFRELDDVSGIAAALTTLGVIYSNLKEYAAAEKAYAEALERCRQSAHRVGESQALTGLFVVASQQGDTDKARVLAEASLKVSYDVGNRLGMAIAHHNLGYTAANVVDHTKAVDHFQQALQIYATLEADPWRTSNTRRFLAASLMAQGQFALAAAQLGQALESLPEAAWAQRGAELLLVCAQLFVATGQRPLATRVLAFLHEGTGISMEVQNEAKNLLAGLPSPPPPADSSWAALLTAVRAHLDKS